MPRRAPFVILVTLLALFPGCKKDEGIIVYSAPKDAAPATAPAMPTAENIAPPVEQGAAASPLSWTVPAGWKQLAGGALRFASFQVSENPPVQMSVTPLGMEAADPL